MKIATYNVNSINSRIELLKLWLQRSDIDVLCIQELKCEDDKFPYIDFEELGYKCEVFGQKQYNGVAICSRMPFEQIQKGFGDEWDEQKRLIYAKIKGFNILNLYVPHGELEGERHIYKLKFFDRVCKFIKENNLSEDYLIVVGDMNVAHREIDVYDPIALEGSIGFLKSERQKFETFMKETDLIDLYRHFYPDKKEFSWWDYRGGAIWKNQGMRLDYILASVKATNRAQDITIDLWPRRRRTPTPSDHTPVIATFSSL